MKIAVIILVVVGLLGCSKKSSPDYPAEGDGVVFTNFQSFDYDIEIRLWRSPSGTVKVEAYRLENEASEDGRIQPRPRLLTVKEFSPEIYAEVVRTLESEEFRSIAIHYPEPGLDGWTWEFKRLSGRMNLTYSFFTPEWSSDAPGVDSVLRLGALIVEAAGLQKEFPRLEKNEESNRVGGGN